MQPADSQPRPAWPVTVGAVLIGWCLIAWTLFAGVINTAPFFGELPSRSENIESGLAVATAAVPLALLATLAGRWGTSSSAPRWRERGARSGPSG